MQRYFLPAFRVVSRSSPVKQSAEQARLFWVRGRVQGVGFRFFVQRAATAMGLTGYVKNLDDGRVEVYAVGSPEKLSELAGVLWKGPPYAEVRAVEEQEAPVRRLGSFRIEPGW
jgi:acylphosphatase